MPSKGERNWAAYPPPGFVLVQPGYFGGRPYLIGPSLTKLYLNQAEYMTPPTADMAVTYPTKGLNTPMSPPIASMARTFPSTDRSRPLLRDGQGTVARSPQRPSGQVNHEPTKLKHHQRPVKYSESVAWSTAAVAGVGPKRPLSSWLGNSQDHTHHQSLPGRTVGTGGRYSIPNGLAHTNYQYPSAPTGSALPRSKSRRRDPLPTPQDGELPQGWELMYSERYRIPHYKNTKTQWWQREAPEGTHRKLAQRVANLQAIERAKKREREEDERRKKTGPAKRRESKIRFTPSTKGT